MSFVKPVEDQRSIQVMARFTPAETEVIDGLAAEIPGGRSGVIRAALDALIAQRQAPAGGNGKKAGARKEKAAS